MPGGGGKKNLSAEQRFWAKVDKNGKGPNCCWVWIGKRNGVRPGEQPYGMFWLEGRYRSAHRISFEWANGPTTLVIDHLCRNRLCVRPDHLQAVEHRTNILRGVGMGARWAARTHCACGEPLREPGTRKNRVRYCPACERNRWDKKRGHGVAAM